MYRRGLDAVESKHLHERDGILETPNLGRKHLVGSTDAPVLGVFWVLENIEKVDEREVQGHAHFGHRMVKLAEACLDNIANAAAAFKLDKFVLDPIKGLF